MTATPDFSKIPCMCGMLRVATRAVTRLYNEEMAGSGVEATQFSLLLMLSHVGPMTQNDIAAWTASEKTTISRNLQLMEQHEWIRIEPGDDRRTRIVTLTPSGSRQLATAMPYWSRAQARLKAAVDDSRFSALRQLLPQVSSAALSA